MIIESIITGALKLMIWWVDKLPSLNIDLSALQTLQFVQTAQAVKEHLNFFLTTNVANFVILVMFVTAPVLIVFAIVKLVRYFLPVV